MRILIAGVNYAPEPTGLAPYTTGLAEHFSQQGHDVVVATTFPFAPMWKWYEPPPRWRTRQRINGVDVWRTKIVIPPKRTSVWRIAFDSSVGWSTALTALSIPKVDITICISPPIQTALFAAAARHKLGKLVIHVQDLPTEAARSVGMLKGRFALRTARAVERLGYKLADHIVVISDVFAAYLEGMDIAKSRITEIPNWADVESIRPGKPNHEMRRRLGANPGDFLLVYTGNMGAKQDLLNVVSAAELLKNDNHIKIALIGDGQERARVAADVAERHLDNVRMLPLQSSHDFPTVLTASDALLINQAPLVIDSVVPSKLLAYMASGRPVLAAVHLASTTADLIRRANCGVMAVPGRPDSLAATVRSVASGNGQSETLTTMGLNGCAYVNEHFDRSQILTRWTKLIETLGANGAGN